MGVGNKVAQWSMNVLNPNRITTKIETYLTSKIILRRTKITMK